MLQMLLPTETRRHRVSTAGTSRVHRSPRRCAFRLAVTPRAELIALRETRMKSFRYTSVVVITTLMLLASARPYMRL
jgi:hypothetical protein